MYCNHKNVSGCPYPSCYQRGPHVFLLDCGKEFQLNFKRLSTDKYKNSKRRQREILNKKSSNLYAITGYSSKLPTTFYYRPASLVMY